MSISEDIFSSDMHEYFSQYIEIDKVRVRRREMCGNVILFMR